MAVMQSVNFIHLPLSQHGPGRILKLGVLKKFPGGERILSQHSSSVELNKNVSISAEMWAIYENKGREGHRPSIKFGIPYILKSNPGTGFTTVPWIWDADIVTRQF